MPQKKREIQGGRAEGRVRALSFSLGCGGWFGVEAQKQIPIRDGKLELKRQLISLERSLSTVQYRQW